MRCPSNKEWISFYYKEMPEPRRKILSEHLKSCGRCRQYLTATSRFLEDKAKEEINLEKEQLYSIISQAQKIARKQLLFPIRLKEFFNNLVGNLQWMFTYHRVLAVVTTAALVIALITPFYYQKDSLNRGIIDLQMELVFEEDFFDFYLDCYSLNGYS
ncbi:MAG: hypothetical protein GF375_02150 [Candidatus Omnitrophica bacterium]|nr:hypothetical protein [Candidatus Omnitrophota bacterium]MBD3268916.1 hypothetical protein [Candidatus Omnitrophota bacterium]